MKADYICNCINYKNIFNDATEMAGAVEHSQEISRVDFYRGVEVLAKHKKIKEAEYRRIKNLFILYDTKKDIHYFYIK
jgi:hypothetical protein